MGGKDPRGWGQEDGFAWKNHSEDLPSIGQLQTRLPRVDLPYWGGRCASI